MAVALAACVMPASAGIFTVTPVRIFMKPTDRAVAITITNDGDSEIALQADVNAWRQTAEGADELVSTEDLILAPPIVKVPPKSRQVVRLALLRPADPARQMLYRLIVREVPEATAPKDNTVAVPIALALSMPVFITPPMARRDVRCELVGTAAAPAAACSNTGTAYSQIRAINLSRASDAMAKLEGGHYLLPGARKVLPLSTVKPLTPGDSLLEVLFDDGKVETFPAKLP